MERSIAVRFLLVITGIILLMTTAASSQTPQEVKIRILENSDLSRRVEATTYFIQKVTWRILKQQGAVTEPIYWKFKNQSSDLVSGSLRFERRFTALINDLESHLSMPLEDYVKILKQDGVSPEIDVYTKEKQYWFTLTSKDYALQGNLPRSAARLKGASGGERNTQDASSTLEYFLLKLDFDNLQQEKKKIEAERNQLKLRVEELEAEKNNLQAQLGGSVEDQVDKVLQQIETLRQTGQSIEEAAQANHLKRWREELNRVRADKDRLQQKLVVLQGQSDQVTQQFEASLQQTRGEKDRLQRELGTLQRQHDRVTKELETLQKHAVQEAEGLREQLRQAQVEKESLQLELRGLQSRYDELTRPKPFPGRIGLWGRSLFVMDGYDDVESSPWSMGDVFSLALLREGRAHWTYGGQVSFSYQNLKEYNPQFTLSTSEVASGSVTLSFGPPPLWRRLGISLSVGVAGKKRLNEGTESEIRSRSRTSSNLIQDPVKGSTHIIPVADLNVRFYLIDSIVLYASGGVDLDAVAEALDNVESVLQSEHVYRYEAGIRLYITSLLNLNIGYGQWRLGNRNVEGLQIAYGYTF